MFRCCKEAQTIANFNVHVDEKEPENISDSFSEMFEGNEKQYIQVIDSDQEEENFWYNISSVDTYECGSYKSSS